MKKTLLVMTMIGALALSGCVGAVAGKVVGKVAEPVLDLASEDATVTLAWIDAQVAAGNISEQDAALAKACPEAVVALEELRTAMAIAASPDAEGFKGLIYYGTLKKYGDGGRDEVVRGINQVAASCLPLVPYSRLIHLF